MPPSLFSDADVAQKLQQMTPHARSSPGSRAGAVPAGPHDRSDGRGRQSITMPAAGMPVVGSSMAPSIRSGDVVLVRPSASRLPNVGDVVIFEAPEGGCYVHRIVHLWGAGAGAVALESGDGDDVFTILPITRIVGFGFARATPAGIAPIPCPARIETLRYRLALCLVGALARAAASGRPAWLHPYLALWMPSVIMRFAGPPHHYTLALLLRALRTRTQQMRTNAANRSR